MKARENAKGKALSMGHHTYALSFDSLLSPLSTAAEWRTFWILLKIPHPILLVYFFQEI